MVRTAQDGIVAAVAGQTLDHGISIFRRSYGDFEWDTESIELLPSGIQFAAMLGVRDGSVTYRGSGGSSVASPTGGTLHGWHYVTLTHYVARGQTALYVDGELAGIVTERLQPELFILGGPGDAGSGARAARADYKDWMIHRAGLNTDEVTALHNGELLQASLEVYAPLGGKHPSTAENRAQSLSKISIGPYVVVVDSDTE
jgi:hypothetical protein